MSMTTKTERLATAVQDFLSFKYGQGNVAKKYDSSSNVYLQLTGALVKFEPQAAEAPTANPITGVSNREFVPDVARVGFDLGKAATGSFTCAAAPSAPTGVVAKNTITGLAILDTDTVVVNGVTFTAVAAAPAANEFLSGPGAGSDADSMADLARAINASASAGVANIYAVQDGVAPTKVNLYAKYSGTGPNAWTVADGGAGKFTPGGATFSLGTAGSTAVINGVTFQTVNAADYAIVIAAPVPGSGPGTLFFSEGTTAASCATNLAAVINASTAAGVDNVVVASIVPAAPTIVVITAANTGVAGNLITTTRAGTSVPAAGGAVLTGGLEGSIDKAAVAFITAAVAMTGVAVSFYSKTAIAITDLVASNTTDLYQTFRNEWGYLNQQ